MMNTAASIAVEVVVDLGNLDADLKRAEARTRSSANTIANDLGKVERAADGAATSTGRAAGAVSGTAAKLEQAFGQAARAAASGSLTMASLETAMMAASRATGPLGLAIIGVTIAVIKSANEVDRLQASLGGLGRSTGNTVAGLLRIADASAAAGRVSVSTARDMVAGYNATGKIGAEIFGGLVAVTKDYANTLGIDMAQATRQLTDAFADPARGADELQNKLGLLDDRTREHIRSLTAANDQTGAQRALLDALGPALASTTANTNALAAAWNFVANAASNAGTAMANALRTATMQEQYQKLIDTRNKLQEQRGGNAENRKAADTYLQKQIDDMSENIRRQGQLASQAAQTATAQQVSIVAGNLTRALDPLNAKFEDLKQKYSTLGQALQNPQHLANAEKTREAYDSYGRAIETLTDKQGNLISSTELLRQKDVLSLAAKKATTDAEKASIAQQQKSLDLAGDVITKGEAARRVQQAGAMASVAGSKASGAAASDAASAYDNLIQRTRDRIEELRLEAQYASKSATEVIKLKLAHDLERAAKKDGTAVTDAMRQEWDRLGDSLAAATQKMEAARLAQQQLKDGLRETAESLSSLFKDLASGKGFDAAVKSLGSRYLDQVIDGLLTGKGQIGVALGLAPTEKGGIGGLLNLDWSKMTKAVEKGSSAGTFSGFANIFGFGEAQQGPTQTGATLDQANRGSALSGIAGIGSAALGAYGAGASGGALVGGLTGAISGAAAGAAFGPAGMAIGAILGAGAGILGASSAAKKAKEERTRQAQQAYEDAKPQFASFGSQLRGDPQNTLALQIEEARAATRKLTDTAFFANKIDEANKLYQDFVAYEERIKVDFARAYDGLASNLASGVGPDSPFGQARDAVKALGTALKGFIDDTGTVFGKGSPQVERSTEAARAYAIAVLDGAKSMSITETRMQEIRGAGAGLQQVLVDLGMAADQAANAVSAGTTAALDRLTATANNDLRSKINESQGFGYLNEISALLKEVAGMKADGIFEPGLISGYFQSEAQNIIDGAQLTGDAYARLLAATPELVGNVNEFTGALKGVAREADIAARRLNAQDRLFGATNDNSTLAGQLAAYNRAALREREAELKAGGEAMVQLEQAHNAERFNIVKAWNDKILDDQKRAAEEARSFWERFSKQIKEYTDGLRAGSESPLSPQARLAAAQSQYNAQMALAQGGDRDALSGITGYHSDMIEAARAFHASSTAFQEIWSSSIAQLEALPDQVSETQLIIDAIDAGAQATVDMLAIMKSSLEVAVNSGSASQIAAALSTYFNRIDSNTSGSIDFSEMQAALGGMASNSQLYSMFTRLDTDASGSLDKMELIRTAAQGTTTAVDGQDAWLSAIQSFTQSTNNNALSIANAAEVQKASLAAIQTQTTNDAGYSNRMAGLLDTLTQTTNLVRSNVASANNRVIIQGNSGAVQGYATGGYVSGPGSSTSDSISARLSDGEFIMRAAAVDRFGVGMLNQMNDNFRMPAVAMPVMAGGGGQSNAALIAEIKALRAEVKALREDTRKGAALVGGEVAGVNASVRAGNATTEDTNKMARRVRKVA